VSGWAAVLALLLVASPLGLRGAEHDHAEAPAPAAEEPAAPTEHHAAAGEPAAETGTPAEAHAPAEHQAAAEHPAEAQPEPAIAAAEAPAVPRSNDLHKEARGLLNLGASLAERGDFPAAEIAYWQILHNRTYAAADQCDALLGLARMHRKQGVFTKAAAVYERFLKLYPDDARVPDALLELGRCQRAMGAYKNAINRFYNVINSTLKLPAESYDHYQLLAKTAQFEIAETHFETGNFTEAAKFFDRLRLLDLAPEDRARAHFKSACSLLNAGEADKAAAKFTQFIDQWPQDANVPEARYLLALTLRQLGRTEDALTITLTLLRTQQGNAGADPKTWAYWQRRTGNQLANEFFQSGDTLSAVAIYEGLTHLSDNAAWRLPIVYQMGLCYERLRQADRATKSYQEIVDAVTHPAGKDPLPNDLVELAKMAQWRIGQLEWSGHTDSQLTHFFSAATPPPPRAAPPATPAPHDANEDPAAAPRSL
jgi:TolA-binding protein